MITPVLETERLILRPFNIRDAREVFECWESDPDVARYMYWTSHNDINKTKEWIESEIAKINSDGWYRWAIVSKEKNEIAGTGLFYFDEELQNYSIGYNLGKKFWGKGYATEAMKKIIEFAKNTLEVKEIIGRHATANSASGKVMKKLGFVYVKDIPFVCNDGQNIYEGKEYILKF